MVGVIVCGGKSTRLFPCTNVLSKQLLPLYDKPLIYYPISMLIKAGIKDIAIVTNDENYELYQKILGNGSKFGVNFQFFVDNVQKGTISALNTAGDFFKGKKVCFVLGDNFFYGKQFDEELKKAIKLDKGAYVFGYPVKNPKAFGVAKFDKNKNLVELIEKPNSPPSNLAITGIYCYDERVYEFAKSVKPSKRGEYEVTDLNNMYLKLGELKLIKLKRKNYWLDAGTSYGLFKASEHVYNIIKKTKKQIGCLEEERYKQGFITKQQLKIAYEEQKKSSYGEYLKSLL